MKLKIGVIGLGEGSQILHIPALKDMPEQFEIVAISDISKSAVDFIAQEYNIEKKYYEPLHLIQDKDVDAVIIVSPDQYHVSYCIAALNAGKHVFVEKPVALTVEEVEELTKVQGDFPNQIVMVGYVRRYAKPFLKLKELLSKCNEEITYLRARTLVCETGFYQANTRNAYRPNDIDASIIKESNDLRMENYKVALGDSCTPEKIMTYLYTACSGCHILSAVCDLVGFPEKIKSATHANGGKHIVATFDFGGFMGVFEEANDLTHVQFDESIEIYTTNKRYYLKYDTPYIRFLPTSLEVSEVIDNETKTTTYGPYYNDAFVEEFKEFYNCIAYKKTPLTTPKEALSDIKLYIEMAKQIRE